LACISPRKSRGKGKEKETLESEPPSDDEGEVGQAEFAKARAVLNANIGACHVKLVSHCALSLNFTWNLAGRGIIRKLSTRAQKVNCQVILEAIWLILFIVKSTSG